MTVDFLSKDGSPNDEMADVCDGLFRADEQDSGAEEAYDNIVGNMLIQPRTDWDKLASKTVIGTYVWGALRFMGISNYTFFEGLPRPSSNIPSCNKEIAEMKQLCDAQGVKFILSVIPSVENDEVEGVSSIPHLFDGITYHEPNVTLDNYNRQNHHFNDDGHRVYANYLEKILIEEQQ